MAEQIVKGSIDERAIMFLNGLGEEVVKRREKGLRTEKVVVRLSSASGKRSYDNMRSNTEEAFRRVLAVCSHAPDVQSQYPHVAEARPFIEQGNILYLRK